MGHGQIGQPAPLCSEIDLRHLVNYGLGELLKRVDGYEVDADGIQRVHSINVRGLAALPTSVHLR